MTTKRILIVDEQSYVLASIRTVCKPLDVEVLTASSGQEALAILDDTEVQVLLSYQRVPEISGYALFELVERAYPYITNVLVTEHTTLENMMRSVNNRSVYKIIYQPWHNDELVSTIQDAFDYYQVRKQGSDNAVQRQKMQHLLQQKSHELKVYRHRLQNATLLSDYLPMALIGVSSDWFIAESNLKANRMFNNDHMIGQCIDNVLPPAVVMFIKSFSDTAFEQERNTVVDYQGESYQLTGLKIELGIKTESYLFYAGRSKV